MKEDDQFQTYSIEDVIKLLQKHLGCPDLSMHNEELYTYIQSKPAISQVAIKIISISNTNNVCKLYFRNQPSKQ